MKAKPQIKHNNPESIAIIADSTLTINKKDGIKGEGMIAWALYLLLAFVVIFFLIIFRDVFKEKARKVYKKVRRKR